MKKTHIVLLILVVAALSVLVSVFGDFSTYETFASATTKQPGKSYYVIRGAGEGQRDDLRP